MSPLSLASGNLQAPVPVRSSARWAAALVWGVVAISGVFWGLRLGAPRPQLSGAAPVLRLPEPADPQAVARLLGAGGAEAASGGAVRRLVLTGVVADGSGGGAAVIAVDDDPQRPYRVGQRVRDDLWLQSVQARRAQLGPDLQGPTTVTLELAPLQNPGLLPRS